MPRFQKDQAGQVKQDTRQALLDAAAAEFARKGYRGANINNISLSAGYAKGTIYNYFSSKRELMVKLIQQTAELHLDLISSEVHKVDHPAERMAAFFQAGYEFIDRYLERGLAIVNNLYGPDDAFREEMYLAYQPMFRLMRKEILTPGLEKKVFRDIDPQETSNLLLLIYLGIASQVGPEGKPWVRSESVIDLVLASLLNNREEDPKNDPN